MATRNPNQQQAGGQRVRKKVRRTWPRASRIFTPRSTTRSSRSPTVRATLCRGPAAVVPASRVTQVDALLRPGRGEAAGRAALECGVKNLEVRIKGPGQDANRPCGRSMRAASGSLRSRTSRRCPITGAARRSGAGSEFLNTTGTGEHTVGYDIWQRRSNWRRASASEPASGNSNDGTIHRSETETVAARGHGSFPEKRPAFARQ